MVAGKYDGGVGGGMDVCCRLFTNTTHCSQTAVNLIPPISARQQ